MMEVINVILGIAFIIVNIIDLSGFVDDGIQPFFKKHFRSPLKTKPWLCSYCLTHHIGFLYLIISGNLTLYYYCFLLLTCWLTPIIGNVMIILKEALIKITDLKL